MRVRKDLLAVPQAFSLDNYFLAGKGGSPNNMALQVFDSQLLAHAA